MGFEIEEVPLIDDHARDCLLRCGRVLYGARWQSDLARALAVNDRRVRQWMAGERPIPWGVWADIAGLLRERQQEGTALLIELDRARQAPPFGAGKDRADKMAGNR